MVVRIRLARGGATHLPYYRIVAADARAKRDGRFLEHLGAYGALAHGKRATDKAGLPPVKRVLLNVPRIRYWMSVGAQPTDTVARLLGAAGVLPPSPRVVRRFPGEEKKAPTGLADALDAGAGKSAVEAAART